MYKPEEMEYCPVLTLVYLHSIPAITFLAFLWSRAQGLGLRPFTWRVMGT